MNDFIDVDVHRAKQKRSVKIGLSFGSGPGPAVEISFPDGRSVGLSVDEWVALAVFAIQDASRWRYDVAANYRRQLIAGFSADLAAAAKQLQDRLQAVLTNDP